MFSKYLFVLLKKKHQFVDLCYVSQYLVNELDKKGFKFLLFCIWKSSNKKIVIVIRDLK